ncbi:MAG TPA: hypothetical protein VGP80_08880 [Gemmatimonadales bacterium]|nr:hypothetical protein [Gemmatimonadales bacterium]
MRRALDHPMRLLAAVMLINGCGVTSDEPTPSLTSTTLASHVALSDLTGLYPGGNTVPALHNTLGLAQARLVTPRSTAGLPTTAALGGRIILLGIGFSNMTQEWCTQFGLDGVTCSPWTFMGQAAASPLVRKPTQGLRLFNGALAGQTIVAWDNPADSSYTRVDSLLKTRGLSSSQVQAVVLKVADLSPTVSLPAVNADAYVLARRTGSALRALRVRYRNLRMVFLISRAYGGYAVINLNPEPFAYEGGLAVKWVIAAQILQEKTGKIDPIVGDLAQAPWVAWGSYLWADGMHPRLDGLTWAPSDFESDGTHPSQQGEQKVGSMLLGFVLASPYTGCWITPGRLC